MLAVETVNTKDVNAVPVNSATVSFSTESVVAMVTHGRGSWYYGTSYEFIFR